MSIKGQDIRLPGNKRLGNERILAIGFDCIVVVGDLLKSQPLQRDKVRRSKVRSAGLPRRCL